jgi:hypothetical protein
MGRGDFLLWRARQQRFLFPIESFQISIFANHHTPTSVSFPVLTKNPVN